MANRTHFLQCIVHLTDKAAYDAAFAQAELGGGWILGISPDDAATTYGAPLINPFPSGTVFAPPCITSGYFASSFNYPKNVAQFTKKSGGWFGLPFLFGDTHTYKWCFEFKYAGAPSGETEVPGEPAPVAMGTRRFVDGFELGEASSPTGNAGQFYSPAASRHIGGQGLQCRNGQTISVQHSLTESGGAADNKGWDRFYIRLQRAPLTSQDVFRMVGAISSQAGCRILINPAGQLEIQNVDAAITRTSQGTGATLTIGQWYKIDVLWRTGAAPDSYFKVYVGGVLSFQVNGGSLPAGTGLTQVQNVTGTVLCDGHTSAHRGAWDLDDWIGSQLPVGGANPALFPSRDWNEGSKVVYIKGKAAAASNTGNWAGPGGANANDWRFTTQRPITTTSAQVLTTATASQRFAVVTDADRRIDYDPLNRGANGITGCVHSSRASGALDAVIGVKLPSAAEVTKTIPNEGTAFTAGTGQLTHAGGAVEPVTPMAGTEVSFTCNSAAVTHSLAAVGAQVECIGIFHPEDYVPQTGDPASLAETGLTHWLNTVHHQRYEDSPHAIYGQPTPAIVVIHTRTYVGNATSQQLAFRVAPTWVFVRNIATHQFTWWFCGMPCAARHGEISLRPNLISRAFIDPNFTEAAEDDQTEQSIIEITGNDAAINANAVTYNMLAWCDPGMRFSEVVGLVEPTASNEARTTFFNDPEFIPEHAHGFRSITGNATTPGLYSKGLGNAANELMLCNVATIASGLTFITGGLQTPASSGLYANSVIQTTFLCLRRIDDPDDQDVGIEKVMQLASWTGDGTASRTVSLGPATGRRPMWAMVTGNNGAVRVRDASHTSTNSLNVAAVSQVTDGITGGAIDSISVGSALNASGVLYEALVFPGCDAVAVNNGWGGNCESIPVPPKSPPRPPIVPPVTPPTGPTPGTPGTTPLTPTGTITQCPTESTIVINMALSRIGISKQLTSTTLNTEVSPEATVARLHYDEDVRAILRDFPWPFATRYETLVQVAGPASEQDNVQAYSATVAYTKNSVVRVAGVDYYALGSAAAGTPVTNTAAWTTVEPDEVNGDWLYAYRAPTLMAMARRVVNNTWKTRRQWDLTPPDFRVGSDSVGAIIYSNEVNAELEYTVLDNCVARQGDALFRNALAWRHAHALAPALTRDEKITASCWAQYERLLRDARTSAAQEKQDPHEGNPDWIAGRD